MAQGLRDNTKVKLSKNYLDINITYNQQYYIFNIIYSKRNSTLSIIFYTHNIILYSIMKITLSNQVEWNVRGKIKYYLKYPISHAISV